MIEQEQGVLPFNQYNGQSLVVTLRGPRVTPQFVATGGLLHAYNPYTNEPLIAHEYPQPPEWATDTLGELAGAEDVPTPIGGDDLPFEEQVAGYVEHTAQILYDLIQDTAELQRVAQRFKHRKRPVSQRVASDLDDERAEANTFFGEVLEHYCLNMGANAAEELAQWLAEVAYTLDCPSKSRKTSIDDQCSYGCYGMP